MTSPTVTDRVAVLGAGVMGTGVATLVLAGGVDVVLVDLDEQTLQKARASVHQQLRLARLMGAAAADAAEGELVTTTEVTGPHVAAATVVIESVTEKPALKAEVLAAVTAVVPAGTPVLSNTSAIPIDELATSVSRPADLLGAHFMNPPYLIRTVEVIRGPRTGEHAFAAASELLAALGQKLVVVGDGPGFVINRVLQRMINEAARIVEDGVADAETVDAAFTGCLGHPTGPLATADLIGIDNVVDSLQVLLDRTGDEGYRPCKLLVSMVAAGNHGRKTGRGFHEHGGAQ